MAVKYPYVSPGLLGKTMHQFRKKLPQPVNAAQLKKLGIAPNNESYVINTLRFLSLIDADGQPSDEARSLFAQYDDGAFSEALATVTQRAYKPLFELHGDGAWTLSKSDLITFFRNDDQSTEIVGTRQATTFLTLAELAGHAPTLTAKPESAMSTRNRKSAPSARPGVNRAKSGAKGPSFVPELGPEGRTQLGLALRVELVLPATTDQAVYDTIFRSIRENFIDVDGA